MGGSKHEHERYEAEKRIEDVERSGGDLFTSSVHFRRDQSSLKKQTGCTASWTGKEICLRWALKWSPGNWVASVISVCTNTVRVQDKRIFCLHCEQDSGGFQMVSLVELSEVTEEGVKFKSPYDGQEILLTPEQSIAIQNSLGKISNVSESLWSL